MLGLAYLDFFGDLNGIEDCYAYLKIERGAAKARSSAGAACGARTVKDYGGGVGIRPILLLGLLYRVLDASGIDANFLNGLFIDTLAGYGGSGLFAYAIEGGGHASGLLIDVATIGTRLCVGLGYFIGLDGYDLSGYIGYLIYVVWFDSIGRLDDIGVFLAIFRRSSSVIE